MRGIRDAWDRLIAALQAIAGAVQGLQDDARSLDAVLVRLDELERSRAIWEAEMVAQMRLADVRAKAAKASEDRARKWAKERPDETDADGAQAILAAQPGIPSTAPGMLPVREGVGNGGPVGRKAAAVAAKWGVR